MKKTTLLVVATLMIVSGVGAYTFGDEFLDEIADNSTEEEIEEVEEKPEPVLEDLVAVAFVNTNFGINEYNMEEVDDGDNNEEEVVEETLYNFKFNAYSSKGNASSYIWNFGDGSEGEGIEISHEYQNPGKFVVKLTISNGQIESEDEIEITIDFDGFVISDNMECTCAPTAKETTIDLKIESDAQEITGETTVTHDGSSEDCTQRLSIQQCHLRVTIQEYDGSSLISQDVIFDDTFSTNTKTVNFTISPNGNNYVILLETDQIRDWHKPNTEWYVRY